MLNDQLNRRPLTPAFRVLVAVALLGVTLPIAALAQASFSSFSGSVVDPMNGLLPKVTLLLTNTETQAKYEVRSDETGRFQFVGLPPAEYLLETTLPGFSPLRGTVTVAGEDVHQDLRLNVGELHETITVTDAAGFSPRTDQPAVKKRPLPVCADTLPGGIGGRIRPPHKIRDVRPRFPEGVGELSEAQMVRIDALIATDGSVKEATVVPPADPAFAAAAIEAVRQWEFDETLLNCVPVEVSMRVSVTFRPE